jgi:hypothetical protein
MTSSMPGTGGALQRRRHPRKKIIESQLLTADVALDQGGQKQPHRGIVIDLSEGGMALQPFLPLAAGAVGDLRLELPGAVKALYGRGMVAWVGNGGRAGIRFIDVPPDARAQLRAWLRQSPADDDALNSPLGAELIPGQDSDLEEIDFQAALQLIAERAQVIAGASGAAIAIGDSHGMVCRASCGAAPDRGVAVTPGRGLSGHCLSTAEIVYCADTQSDPRIDATAARQLGLGSIVIVPVFAEGQLAGLFQVLAPRPHGFNSRQLTRLERFSELLGTAIEEYLHKNSLAKAAAALSREERQEVADRTPASTPLASTVTENSPAEAKAAVSVEAEPPSGGSGYEPPVPLSSYGASARPRRVLRVVLIVLLLLCVLAGLCALAGWYVGRAHATPRGASSPVKAKIAVSPTR